MPLRILHISTRLILGGSQENTVLSCEGQARRGHEVHLAFGPIYGPEGSLLERVQKFRTDDGRAIFTHQVPHLLRELRPISDLHGYSELRRLIRSVQPDIVHTHSSKAGVLGRAAAWREAEARTREAWTHEHADTRSRPASSIGIVHTIHGPPFMPIEGSSLRRAKTRLNNWIYTRAEKYASGRCHVIVSVADAMTRQFLARGIGHAEQYTTVRSGMEVDPFLIADTGEDRESVRATLGIGGNVFVIGTVARLAQHKGHDDLLDALAVDMKRDGRMKLLWIGDGWWRTRLIERAMSLGLRVVELDRADRAPTIDACRVMDATVILAGLVPPERIPGLMRAMDVLAHPSSREGLPRTVPQALLAGVCPVAYDCDGTGEVCMDTQTGRLVRTGNVQGLGDAIRWLRDHPGERQQMAERGREFCRERFSTETMIDELDRVYQLALQRAGAGLGGVVPLGNDA